MSAGQNFRILFWNIQHGGGRRADGIATQILAWQPDIVALAEFRGTAPSQCMAGRLRDAGYVHQLTTVNPYESAWNALLLASRHESTPVNVEGAPATDLYWLLGKVESAPNIHVGVIHVPLDTYMPGFWLEYRNALLRIAGDRRLGPAVFLGDMNSAISGLDEETEYSLGYKESFMNPMGKLGWVDPFRVFHPNADAPTWISRAGRGFRLDQAFVCEALQPHVRSCFYDWGHGDEQQQLSDHAAILIDLDLGAAAASM